MNPISSILAFHRSPARSGTRSVPSLEPLEARQLFANTIQIALQPQISTVSAKDVQNIGLIFLSHDLTGMLTLTGNNLASQTVGNRVNVTGNVTDFTSLSLSNTAAFSSLVIHDKGAAIPLHDFNSVGPMRMIDIRPLLISGPMNVVGAPQMKVGNALSADITVSQQMANLSFSGGNFSNSRIHFLSATPGVVPNLTLKFNRLSDTRLSSDGLIRTLNLNAATQSTPGAGSISANSVGNITVGSDYKYDLNLKPTLGFRYTLSSFRVGGTGSGAWNIPGSTNSLSARTLDSGFGGAFGMVNRLSVANNLSGTLTAGSLGNAIIGHDLLNSTINLTNPYAQNSWNLGSLHVGNTIQNSTISSNGNLGDIATMFTYYSTIKAGISPNYVFGQPLTSSAYTSTSSIKSFVSDCPSHHNIHYVGSYVGASTLQSVTLGNVQTQYGGSPFGLAGLRMDKVSILLNDNVVALRSLASTADLDAGLKKYGLTRQSLNDLKLYFAD